MPTNKYELAELISHRDGISMNDAMNCIEECSKEIEYALETEDYNEVESILADFLGLEPDYLDIFLM